MSTLVVRQLVTGEPPAISSGSSLDSSTALMPRSRPSASIAGSIVAPASNCCMRTTIPTRCRSSSGTIRFKRNSKAGVTRSNTISPARYVLCVHRYTTRQESTTASVGDLAGFHPSRAHGIHQNAGTMLSCRSCCHDVRTQGPARSERSRFSSYVSASLEHDKEGN